MLHTHTHTHTHTFLDYAANKIEFDRLQVVYRCNSAVVTCGYDEDILTIDYSGVINQAAFHLLDLQTQSLRMSTPVALERQDRALTLGGPIEVCPCAWGPGTPPSAIIVRDDQYPSSVAFGLLLRDRGILRLTFLAGQESHARNFVRSYQGGL